MLPSSKRQAPHCSDDGDGGEKGKENKKPRWSQQPALGGNESDGEEEDCGGDEDDGVESAEEGPDGNESETEDVGAGKQNQPPAAAVGTMFASPFAGSSSFLVSITHTHTT